MKSFKRNRLAVAVAGGLVLGSPAMAAFTEVTEDNPFDAVTTNGTQPSVSMMDLDNDGDLDLVLHHTTQTDSFPYAGTMTQLSVYENVGSPSSPEFAHVADESGPYGSGQNISVNPFAGDFNDYGHPVTVFDADGDDVPDFIGGHDGSCCANFYGSVGLVQTDVYGAATGANFYTSSTDGYGANPFYNAQLSDWSYQGYGVSHAAGDLDNDEDMDLITTDRFTLRVWQNDGVDTNSAGIQFNELTGTSPFDFSALGSDYYGAPVVMHDVDGDGDPDVVMGTRTGGDLRLFENVGTAATADFEEVLDTTGTIDVTAPGWAAPTFADIDGDGDDDLIVAAIVEGSIDIRLFENTPPDDDLALLLALEAADDDDDGFLGSTGILGIFGALGAMLMRRRRR